MQLHEKIFQCRKRCGLSQQELADRLGVSRQAVSKWELGTALPELDKLKLLAGVFCVSADWLLDETQDAPPAPLAGSCGATAGLPASTLPSQARPWQAWGRWPDT